MNDLNVIERKNTEAALRDIPSQVALGKYVVAEYDGLHYLTHSVFDTAAEASDRQAIVAASLGQRAVVHGPEPVAA